ncbi:BppU family phage baseplate upper protein [Clostridium perfringens]|uniref:BppU family phage baseplate upper protein n=1 Tax=Clostridium perfringens TaxID=1502 RepID=UPI00244433F9|nr:BppU family phage baseplate upper protein [Clostridium perfringens]MDG6892685.1 hypothetical protein [Clostridium perfringens]
MKEIYINADDYNSDSIRTIQGNNNAEEYKIYLQYDNEKIDLTGKTVNLGFLRVGSTEGDIIENLNVTNPKEGEITLKITNKISKRNGTYSCQLAILGERDFLEHTATFTLTVENNIFSDITKAIADSKDFTYLENILDKASKLSEKLKENTSTATNANSNLESNITEANNINSKLLENTSTATSLNKNLESNIDLAKEVKETIKDLDTKNIEATEKIETLTGLNSKAEELSNNINKGLPLNSELIKNTEEAKAANTNLLAANQEAISKNTELQTSLEKTKKFIDGLDGSQNIPQIRMDVTELQNGLKSNQALSYEGSSIVANETLEGRTEGMRIGGRTLVNFVKNRLKKQKVAGTSLSATLCINEIFKTNTTYTIIYTINSIESGTGKTTLNFSGGMNAPDVILNSSNSVGTHKQTFTLNTIPSQIYRNVSLYHNDKETVKLFSDVLIIEGEVDFIPQYFEGLKSFGEAEQEGDKYKIGVLSHGKNLVDYSMFRASNETKIEINSNHIILEGNRAFANISIKLSDLKLIEGKTYYVKLDIEHISGSNEAYYEIWINDKTTGKKDFIYKKGDKVSLIVFANRDNFPSKNVVKNVIVSEKNEDNYEHYKCDKKNILISAPLRSVYDIQDIMHEDNGQVKINRVIGHHTFTGDETITQVENNSKAIIVIINNIRGADFKHFISNKNIGYDVRWNVSEWENDYPIAFNFVNSSKGYVTLLFSKTKIPSITDINSVKQYLRENNLELYYKLATPTVEVVENCVDIDLDTFQEKTYFSIENSLPGTLDFKVPSNIGSVVQNMAKEVNNIWDVINNLLVPSIVKANGNIAMIKLNNNLK